jgi:hypothetical protein
MLNDTTTPKNTREEGRDTNISFSFSFSYIYFSFFMFGVGEL